MKRVCIYLLICVAIAANGVSLAQGIDFDALSLDDVLALSEAASDYYNDMTRIDKASEDAVEALLVEALETHFAGSNVTKPMFGFSMSRARNIYTVEDNVKIKGASGKQTYAVKGIFVFDDVGKLQLTELYIDDVLTMQNVTAMPTPQPTTTPSPRPTSTPKMAKYGELLHVTTLDGICVVKYKVTSQLTKKLTVRQNYENLIGHVIDNDCSQYKEIQYWAVADMRDGSEAKIISFTVPDWLIAEIATGSILAHDLPDNLTDLWIHPSLR